MVERRECRHILNGESCDEDAKFDCGCSVSTSPSNNMETIYIADPINLTSKPEPQSRSFLTELIEGMDKSDENRESKQEEEIIFEEPALNKEEGLNEILNLFRARNESIRVDDSSFDGILDVNKALFTPGLEDSHKDDILLNKAVTGESAVSSDAENSLPQNDSLMADIIQGELLRRSTPVLNGQNITEGQTADLFKGELSRASTPALSEQNITDREMADLSTVELLRTSTPVLNEQNQIKPLILDLKTEILTDENKSLLKEEFEREMKEQDNDSAVSLEKVKLNTLVENIIDFPTETSDKIYSDNDVSIDLQTEYNEDTSEHNNMLLNKNDKSIEVIKDDNSNIVIKISIPENSEIQLLVDKNQNSAAIIKTTEKANHAKKFGFPIPNPIFSNAEDSEDFQYSNDSNLDPHPSFIFCDSSIVFDEATKDFDKSVIRPGYVRRMIDRFEQRSNKSS